MGLNGEQVLQSYYDLTSLGTNARICSQSGYFRRTTKLHILSPILHMDFLGKGGMDMCIRLIDLEVRNRRKFDFSPLIFLTKEKVLVYRA